MVALGRGSDGTLVLCVLTLLFRALIKLVKFQLLITYRSDLTSRFDVSGMGLDQGRSDQASRSLFNSANVRERHDVADADLRRQREPEVEAPGGWSDPSFEDPGVRGLEIPRAKRDHRGEMRFERRDAEVAPVQP